MSPAPAGILPDTALADARARMFELGVRHLPVIEAGRLVGILSERDVSLAESIAAAPETLTVARAMQTRIFTVGPDAHLHAVASEMAERKIGTALAVDPDRPLVLLGIFTTVDALRALADATGHD
jgi:acetoin utilization protein AcuB